MSSVLSMSVPIDLNQSLASFVSLLNATPNVNPAYFLNVADIFAYCITQQTAGVIPQFSIKDFSGDLSSFSLSSVLKAIDYSKTTFPTDTLGNLKTLLLSKNGLLYAFIDEFRTATMTNFVAKVFNIATFEGFAATVNYADAILYTDTSTIGALLQSGIKTGIADVAAIGSVIQSGIQTGISDIAVLKNVVGIPPPPPAKFAAVLPPPSSAVLPPATTTTPDPIIAAITQQNQKISDLTAALNTLMTTSSNKPPPPPISIVPPKPLPSFARNTSIPILGGIREYFLKIVLWQMINVHTLVDRLLVNSMMLPYNYLKFWITVFDGRQDPDYIQLEYDGIGGAPSAIDSKLLALENKVTNLNEFFFHKP